MNEITIDSLWREEEKTYTWVQTLTQSQSRVRAVRNCTTPEISSKFCAPSLPLKFVLYSLLLLNHFFHALNRRPSVTSHLKESLHRLWLFHSIKSSFAFAIFIHSLADNRYFYKLFKLMDKMSQVNNHPNSRTLPPFISNTILPQEKRLFEFIPPFIPKMNLHGQRTLQSHWDTFHLTEWVD